MRFKVENKAGLWIVDDAVHGVGGLFVDLRAALRFIRQYDAAARIVVAGSPAV